MNVKQVREFARKQKRVQDRTSALELHYLLDA